MKSIIIAGVIGVSLFAATFYFTNSFIKKEEPAATDPVTEFDGKLPMVDTTKAQEQMPL